ncbi:ABC-2 type transport system ATP-binding protein [Lachnospiraceae bacterium YSD2013]|nr:ABC-2 type transport system ATP-binding protein [Lachnospiraceae bacterium YSD2013]
MKISVENISKKYRNKEVLSSVSFEAESGMQVGIVGKNGIGKSTLLSILAGVNKADGGKFLYEGRDLLADKDLRNKVCAYIPQETPLISELSARDNLRMWYSDKALKKELSEGFLKTLGIDRFLKVNVRKMSGGMKKRLSIGCAIYADPRVLILDEPTASLDLECKGIINDYLDAFKKRGGIVVLATHDEKEIENCDALYLLKDKEMNKYVYDGSIKNLVDSF